MKPLCMLAKTASALGWQAPAAAHAARCPACRHAQTSAAAIDALLRHPPGAPAPSRAPASLIAAVRAVNAETQAPAPSRLPSVAVWGSVAVAAAVLALVVGITASQPKPEPPAEVATVPKTAAPLPTAAVDASATAAPLPLADFESEFALLAADFRRGSGNQ